MNVVKCKICREHFHSYGSQVCPACLEQMDKDFFVVRDYIYAHSDQTSIEQIAEATGVKDKHIIYLLEEGRLATTGGLSGAGLNAGLKCQVCGRPVSSGKLCESCKGALTKELGSASAALDSGKSAKSSYETPRSSKYQSDHNKIR